MKIIIVTPAPPGSRYGNRVTALRWARLLRELGHRVRIAQSYAGEACDLLVALHARRSHAALKSFHRLHPDRPLLVALTGTDLYRDLKHSARAHKSLALATRLIVLQPQALDELPAHLHAKTRVMHQSLPPIPLLQAPISDRFTVAVVGHLRAVKDPFRAALAARLLPASSRIEVLHVGGALDERMAARARAEMARNPRYRRLGEQPRERTRQIIARSNLLVLSSKLEGGANVLSEALVAGTPVLASQIAGNIGLLGEDYPGYFAVGDTRGLARLLLRAETEPEFLGELKAHGAMLAGKFEPARERAAWAELLREFV